MTGTTCCWVDVSGQDYNRISVVPCPVHIRLVMTVIQMKLQQKAEELNIKKYEV